MDKATTPRGDLADAVMSFQVLINVRPFFVFWGREQEAGRLADPTL